MAVFAAYFGLLAVVSNKSKIFEHKKFFGRFFADQDLALPFVTGIDYNIASASSLRNLIVFTLRSCVAAIFRTVRYLALITTEYVNAVFPST